jgi:hypothetical protein
MSIPNNASLITSPLFIEFDTSGRPLAGGKLYTYAAGTLTPLATYTDATLTVTNANPVVLDNYGKAQIWFGSQAYKLNLTDSLGVQQPDYPIDNIILNTQASLALALSSSTTNAQGQGLVGFNPALTYAAGTLPAALASTAAGMGAALVGWMHNLVGAVGRTVGDRLRDSVSVKDFGAKGDTTAAGVGTDDTAAIIAAYTAVAATGGTVRFPQGRYKFTSQLVMPVGVNFKGAGRSVQSWFTQGAAKNRPTVLYKSGNFDGIQMNEGCSIQEISVDGASDTATGAVANAGNGICLVGLNASLRNVGVTNHGGWGISVGNGVWIAGRKYSIGNRVTNGNAQYICTQSGTAAGAGGPTGTGTGIVDNTVYWNYVGVFAGTSTSYWHMENISVMGNTLGGITFNDYWLGYGAPYTNNNAGTLKGFFVGYNTGDGFDVYATYGNLIEGGYSTDNGFAFVGGTLTNVGSAYGFHVGALATYNTFAACGGEANTSLGWIFDAGSNANSMIGCNYTSSNFADNGTNHIHIPSGGTNNLLATGVGNVARTGSLHRGMLRSGSNAGNTMPSTALERGYTQNGFGAQGTYPGIYWWDSASTNGMQLWEAYANAQTLTFGQPNSSYGVMNPFMTFTTTGTAVRMGLPMLAASTTYANDGAAAAGGVPIGGTYRNGSVVMVRVT